MDWTTLLFSFNGPDQSRQILARGPDLYGGLDHLHRRLSVWLGGLNIDNLLSFAGAGC